MWIEKAWVETYYGPYIEEGEQVVPIPDKLMNYCLSKIDKFPTGLEAKTPIQNFVEILDSTLKKKRPIETPEIEQPVEPTKKIVQTEEKTHTKIQAILAQLGKIQNYEIFIAQNDRNKSWEEVCLSDISLTELPSIRIPDNELKIIKLIDVLWLKQNYIARAIEIEYTTSIYSGLLRLSDLAISIPNININLSIVIPENRVNKFESELNRPTFSELKNKGVSYCTFEEIENIFDRFKTIINPQLKVENILPWHKFATEPK
jgi:hypothetical protein